MMIDWGRANELLAEIGCEGFAEVVDLFLDEVEAVVLRLEIRPEPAQYEADLHFLKGGAWNLGFAEFGALCQDGERKAESLGPPETPRSGQGPHSRSVPPNRWSVAS